MGVSLPRAEHLRTGRAAEDWVLAHMERQGMRCLERNYRSRFGEIDLIMQDEATVVFVEVRYRRSATHGQAIETVDGRKQARLRATANCFLTSTRWRGPVRFDVVGVAPEAGSAKFQLQWIRNAIQD